MSTKFLLAKYVPDLRRMEPRNIGVVVWSEEAVVCRFAGESEDGVRPPANLHVSLNAYRQWVDYWRLWVSRDKIKGDDGVEVKRSDVRFLDVLKQKSREQFLLIDGGFLMKDVGPKELPVLLDELFEELVGTGKPPPKLDAHAESAQRLRQAAKKVLKESALDQRSDFQSNYNWLCPVGMTKQHFQFDFALHGRRPKMLMSRLLLWEQSDVESLAFKFEKMRDAYDLPREQCTALVYATNDILKEKDVKAAKKMMELFGTVVNLADENRAADSLRSLAPSNKNSSTACLRPRGSRQSSFLRRLSSGDSGES